MFINYNNLKLNNINFNWFIIFIGYFYIYLLKMSDPKKLYLLSEKKLDESSNKIQSILDEVNNLIQKQKYYYAFYKLENLILRDGTCENINNIFLNLILDNYDELLNQIKYLSSDLLLVKDDQIKFEKSIANVFKYNFEYFNNCFNKYEITLSDTQLKIITDKKIKHNLKIVQKYPFIKEEYLNLINKIKNDVNYVSADIIKNCFEKINEKIPGENESKLFYINKYLNIKLIESNKIFEYLENDRFYLNQYYFYPSNDLGIPISNSNNLNLKYRYFFSLIKNKINEIPEENSPIKYMFKKLRNIYFNINDNKYDFIKNFVLMFINAKFEDSKL